MLEFVLSGWFRTHAAPSFGGFWCDGFLPHTATNTRLGIDVCGDAWIAEGDRSMRKYAFEVSIPQRMLGRRRSHVALSDVEIDVKRHALRFVVEPTIEAGAAHEK